MDFAVPNKNEEKLLARAKELGSNLTFLYRSKSEMIQAQKKSHKAGFLLIPKKGSDFKKLKGLKTEKIVVMTSQEKLIRMAFENRKIDVIVNLETSTGRDHTHYRRSNVNQVLAKLAKDNKITYGIDFARLIKTEAGKKRATLLGRIKQNLKIFKKYKVNCQIFSLASDEFELKNSNTLAALQRVLEKK